MTEYTPTTRERIQDAIRRIPKISEPIYETELLSVLREADEALAAHDATVKPSREELRETIGKALQAVLWNASNHPNPTAVLGRDFTPLTAKVTDAALAAVLDLLPGRTEAEVRADDRP